MGAYSSDIFPDHYVSIERERRMELLKSPQTPLQFTVGLNSANIMTDARADIFRTLWKNPQGCVLKLCPQDLDPDNTFDFFSGFSEGIRSEQNDRDLRNLIICLRFNDLLSPDMLAQLIRCFSEYQNDDIATYLDLLYYYEFCARYSKYFDKELIDAFERNLPLMMDRRLMGLVERIEMN